MFDLRAQRAASRWRCSSCCIVSHDVVTMQGLLCMVRHWTDRSPSGSSWNTFSSEHTEYLYAATVALLSPFRSSFTHSRRPSGIDSITRFLKGCCSYFNKSNSKSRRHRPWYAPTQHSTTPPASPLHDTEIVQRSEYIHGPSISVPTSSCPLMATKWRSYSFGLIYTSWRRRWW
jgi:hypothetical protein